MLDINTDVDCVMCWEQKDATSFDRNENFQSTDTLKNKVKKIYSYRIVDFAKMSLQELKIVLVRMARTCLYACLATLGHAPNEMTDGFLGDLLPDLHKGITELLDSLR